MRDTNEAQVLCTKTALMQALQRLAGDGYLFHTSGTVPIAKARTLARKFRDLYLTHLGYSARWRRKKLGLGNARLLLWQELVGGPLTFMLLVSPGDHPALHLERLRDARVGGQRIGLTGYELVQYTRRGQDHPSWTWRMTQATYQDWRARIIRCVRNANRLDMEQAWESLHRAPGFGAVRTQVRQLARLFRDEYARRHGKRSSWPMPRRRCWYLSLVPQRSRPLYEVIAEAETQGGPAPCAGQVAEHTDCATVEALPTDPNAKGGFLHWGEAASSHQPR